MDTTYLKCASLECGYLVLEPIVVEAEVSVCRKTVVTPGTVKAGTSLGPWSSTHEMNDADDGYRRFNRLLFDDPHPLLMWGLGYPLFVAARVVAHMPWLLMMQYVVTGAVWTTPGPEWFPRCVAALTEPHRVLLWCTAIAVKTVFTPVIYIFLAVILKWVVCGQFVPGRREGQYCAFKYWFAALILDNSYIADFTALVGAHYYGVTLLYRALGASVGERIFWPGRPLEIVEYDLLEVGDDVIFGSRSTVMCSDRHSSDYVKIQTGAMVADNCLLLPGTNVGPNTTLGSGSVARGEYPGGSVWVGAHHGKAVQLHAHQPAQSGVRPFGRAVYQGLAEGYTLVPWQLQCFVILLMNIVLSPLEPVRAWLGLTCLAFVYPDFDSVSQALPALVVIYMTLHLVLTSLLVVVDVALKWIVVGERETGVYAWDTHSYCQRWKFHVAMRDVLLSRTSALRLLGGTPYIVAYFRAQGARIGENCCLYPWGASPMMTEPDLVSLGDRVSVEDASLVAHTNQLGTFELFTLNVADGATLRDWSRLTAGAEMLRGSTLLEHSLALPGDVVPEYARWQGWPNRTQTWTSSDP